MPQAVTPIRPLVSSHRPNYSYLDAPGAYTSGGRFYKRDPHDWDPERISKHILRHGPPEKSPVLAKLMLDNKVDGHAVMETPRDVLLCGLNVDEELEESLMSTLEALRAKSRYIAPSTKRTPNVRDIAKALGEYYGLSAPPSIPPVPEHHPGPVSTPPSSPPQWDLNSPGKSPPDIPEYLRTPVSRYSSQSSSDSFLQFSTPSTGPQTLLHPVFPFSPETTHILPALHVSDPRETPELPSPPVAKSSPISPLNVGIPLNAVGGDNGQSSHLPFVSVTPPPPHEDIQVTSPPHEPVPTASPPHEAIQVTPPPDDIIPAPSPPHKVIQTSLPIRRFCEVATQTDEFQDVAVQTDMTSSPPQVLQDIEVQAESEQAEEASVISVVGSHSSGVEHVDLTTLAAEGLAPELSDAEDLVQRDLGSQEEQDLVDDGLQERVSSPAADVILDSQLDAQVPPPLVLSITDTATNASSDQFVTPTSDTYTHEVPAEETSDPIAAEPLEVVSPDTHQEELGPDYDTPEVVSLSNTGDSSDVDIAESSYVSLSEGVMGTDSAPDSESEQRSEEPSTVSVANITPPDWDAWEPVDHSDTSETGLVHHDLSLNASSEEGIRTSSDGTFASDEGLSAGEDMLEDLLEEVGGSSELDGSPEPLMDASVLSPTVVELEPREFSDERPLSIPSLPDELIDFNETLSQAETIPDEHDPEAQKQAAHSSKHSSPFHVVPSLPLPSSPDIIPITPPLVPRRKLQGELEPLELSSEKRGDVNLGTVSDKAGDDGVLVSLADAAEPHSSTPSLIQVDIPSHSTTPDSLTSEDDGVLIPLPDGEDQAEEPEAQLLSTHAPNLALPEVSITPAADSVPTIRQRSLSPAPQGADNAASSPSFASIFSPRAFANPSPLPSASPMASPAATIRSPRNLLSTTPLRTASPAHGPATASDPSPTGGASAGLNILAPIHHAQERSMEHEDLDDWHNIAETVHQEAKPTDVALVDRLDTVRGGLRSRSASPRRLGQVHRVSEEFPRPAPSQVFRSPDISSRLRGVVHAAAIPEAPAGSSRGQAWLQRPQGTPPPRELEAGLARLRRDASPVYDSGDAADSSDFDVESQKRFSPMKRRESKKTQGLSDVSQGISTKITGFWNNFIA